MNFRETVDVIEDEGGRDTDRTQNFTDNYQGLRKCGRRRARSLEKQFKNDLTRIDDPPNTCALLTLPLRSA